MIQNNKKKINKNKKATTKKRLPYAMNKFAC